MVSKQFDKQSQELGLFSAQDSSFVPTKDAPNFDSGILDSTDSIPNCNTRPNLIG